MALPAALASLAPVDADGSLRRFAQQLGADALQDIISSNPSHAFFLDRLVQMRDETATAARVKVVSALPHLYHSLHVLDMLSKGPTARDGNVVLQIEQAITLLNSLKDSVISTATHESAEETPERLACEDDGGVGMDD